MPNVLIRDVPTETIAAIDAEAKRLGLSRNEYLRRRLEGDVFPVRRTKVTIEDFERFAERFSDLGDPEVMRQAWR